MKMTQLGLMAVALGTSFLSIAKTITNTDSRANNQPNVVIFMADDLGYGSINANGAAKKFVRTPNINRLANDGINFSNAFATASVCSPTRYAMLTGEYSWRTGLKKGVVNSKGSMLIKPGKVTVASWFKNKGYDTAHVGKWHLGYTSKPFKNLLGKLSPGPNDIGFDYHFAVPNNLDDIHKVYIENDAIYGLKSNKIKGYGKSWYGNEYTGYDAPQRITENVMEYTTSKAIEWINKRKDKPFLLYYAAAAVHHPIRPSEKMKGTSGVGPYGDFIHETDHSVGRILEALAYLGKLENTIFIFTSDNGGDLPAKPYHDGKDWPERVAYDMGFKYNGENLRGDKHTIYEGGLQVPFIVSWPKQLAKKETSNSLISTLDVFSTLVSLLGDSIPQSVAPDGVSFANALKEPGAEEGGRKLLVNRDVKGTKSIRYGEWKYISNEYYTKVGPQTKGEVELYNLVMDKAESSNVARKFPEIASMLKSVLDKVVKSSYSKHISQIGSPSLPK